MMTKERKYSSELEDTNFADGQPDLVWDHENVLDLDDFTVQEIETVIALAEQMREVLDRRIARAPALRGFTVVNLFFEPSTRTRASF